MNRKLFTKIFFSISFVSILGIVSVFMIYQHYFQSVMMDNEMNQVQRSINQASLNLDNQLKRIVNNVYYFQSDNGKQLVQLQPDNAEDVRRARNLLGTFRMQHSDELDSVFYLFRTEGGEEYFIHDSDLSRIRGRDYEDHAWYHDFIQKKSVLWSGPTTDHLFFQDRSIRTIYLTLGGYSEDGSGGVFVVRLNGQIFSEAYRLLVDDDLYIELRDANGRMVYTSFPRISDKESNKFEMMHSDLIYSGFQVQAYINKASILGKVEQIQSLHPVIIVIVLLITLAISFVLSLTLVRPIKRLLLLMKKVENGDLSVRFSSKFHDEIGILGNNFNRMIMNLSNTIEEMYSVRMGKLNAEMKQKDATLLAMQNQINPHFLYNTLEVINCQAILHNVPDISRMSKALADFFRYPIDHQTAEVTLEVEISHVMTYLAIQQERYPDIELDLDHLEPFYHYPVVKLTVQPIVENAFLYAFTGSRDYYLRIYGEDVDRSTYAIFIEDNGEGMTEEQIAQLNSLLEVDYDQLPHDHPGSKGIGLLNVHHRIRLRYGDRYGLRVGESTSGGVLVRILLPKVREGQ